MSASLKLVVHHGERARAGGRLAADALMDAVEEAGVAAAVMMRGVEGFGVHHRLRTDRLLTLSEDLPLVTLVVGSAARVAPLAERAAELVPSGLLTLERAALPDLELDDDTTGRGAGKLTVYCERAAALAVAGALRRSGIEGATVLVGVDGVLGGARRRARLRGGNRGVPAAVIAVGAPGVVRDALPRVRAAAGAHVTCLERVSIVRRAGAAVGPLPVVPERDATGLGLWQRLTVVLGAEDRAAHRLVRDLRTAGAAGATALRGAWAVTDDGEPHAERILTLRRRAPFLLSIIDTPAAAVRLWPIVEAATARQGLVTCELLPAVRISPAVGAPRGGLQLASREATRGSHRPPA